MQPAVLLRLRPSGPWRFGPGEGGQHQVDTLFRSDRLYSALTLAAESLGFLDAWLDATARAQTPAITFSSLFPYQGDTLFAPPPASIWPPLPSAVTGPSPVFLAKMRWEAARFIPVTAIEALLSGQPLMAEQWTIDAESGCLLRRDRPSQSPFRRVLRTRAGIDRVSGASALLHSSACVEFESGSGLWLVLRFRDEAAEAEWSDRVKACFRLLADTGFGGNRKSGWGQTAAPEFRSGKWPALLTPNLQRWIRSQGDGSSADDDASLFWLLSLYSPSSADTVDWSSGSYGLVLRGGRVQSAVHANANALKKNVRMVAEGSVLSARQEPVGTAVDVAPDGFTHPVYRLGFSLSLKLPNPKAIMETAEPVEATPPDSPLEAVQEPETVEAVSIPEKSESEESSPVPETTEFEKDSPVAEAVEPEESAPVPEATESEESAPIIQATEDLPTETPQEESERSDNEI